MCGGLLACRERLTASPLMCEVLERSERSSHISGEAVSRCGERRSGSVGFHHIGECMSSSGIKSYKLQAYHSS